MKWMTCRDFKLTGLNMHAFDFGKMHCDPVCEYSKATITVVDINA